MIGFYQVEDAISETLFTSIKDSLSRMDIPLADCGGQCYDEPSNMDGAKTGLAIQIKKIEPCALSTYCFGHTLQLAVSDNIKATKLIRETFNTAFELKKLIEYCPKREIAFNRLSEETARKNSGYRTLCPTCSTFRALSLQSILDNLAVFQELRDVILERRVDPEVRSRFVGVQNQIQRFDFYFGIQLRILVLRHTDNLSSAL